MKKLILLSIVLLSLLVAPVSEVFAQARLINYQGNILNDKGNPYDGPVQITFELYSAEFGGSQVWSEIQPVTLNNGYFNVYLGSVNPFPANFNFNRDLWLQVTVGKGAPYQRTRLSMVPYSGYSDRSAIAGFAEDIPDGSVTLAKLADEVKKAGGDLQGFYPNPTLRPGAILEGIPDGSITQEKLNANVTTRPSGPASGDLTGFYPDPLIAQGAVKTDRLADGAVTNAKIADFTIHYNKLQNANGPIGTILGWDGTKWIETNVPAWEKGRVKSVLGIDGNYATDVTDADGFITTSVGIAANGVTTPKIANTAVTYAKLQNAAGVAGTILAWNGTSWAETTVPALEADAVIGNEVLNATPNRGLVRAGAGTLASPYTLGITEGGVATDMIADQAVTLNKFANGTMLGQMTWWNAITNSWNYSGGAVPTDNQVLRWIDNGVTRQPVWSNDDAIIGNEITDVVAGGGLQRLGAGTTAAPYTVGVAPQGIVTSMIADDAVTYGKLQNAAGVAGTIIGWNGGHWIETSVPAWEKGKVMAVTAGAGTTVVNTPDADGFISAAVGIADGGVTNNMLANGAVSLSKLAAGTQIGQIMWWDQAANQWRFSTGAAPTQDQVIKWIDAGGSLTPRWAADDMTLPYAKTLTENAQTLFAIENNGNSDVMSLTTTGKGDGLEITVPNDLVDGGHALHVNGGGFENPSLIVNRVSQYGLPTGAATINATVNTLDAETAGMTVNTTINDDGNNAYDVEGIQSFLTVNNAVNDVFYTGVWGLTESSNGIATGVWGDATAVNAQNNIGVVGSGFDAANANVGVLGTANDGNYQAYTTQFGAGFGAGLVALNGRGTVNDYGLFANVQGDATGAQIQADDASAVIGLNESVNNPAIWATNLADGPAFWASSANTDDYSAIIQNLGTGRGLAVVGGKANDENGGMPFLNDGGDDDDAALVVYNPNAASLGGGAAFATAIKTYGDIWANSTIGASQFVGLDKIIVGNPITGPFVEILPPAFVGAPIVIDGPLDVNGNTNINGNLNVDDILADDITADVITANTMNVALGNFTDINVANTATVGGATTLNGATQINNTLNVTGATTLAGLTAGATTLNSLGVTNNATVGGTFGVTGATTLNGATSVNNTLNVTGATTLGNNLSVAGTSTLTGATTLGNTLTVAGATQINNNLGVTGNATIGGTLSAGNTTLDNLVVTGTSNLQGAATLGNNLSVAGTSTLTGNTTVGGTLGVTGHTSLSTLSTTGLASLNSAAVANNATVGGTLGVTGATTLNGATSVNNTLNVTGATTLNGATQINNNLVVTGTSNLQGAATLGNTLTVAGATQVNNTLGVTGATTLGNNLSVAGTSTLTGNTTVGGTLGVTGATTLNNTLAVAGNASFNGANVTTGAATSLNLGNQLFTNGSAGVANNAFLVSRGAGLSPTWTNQIDQLTVAGLLTTEDLQVNDDAVVTGDLTVNGDNVVINADVTMVGTFDLTGLMLADDLLILNSSMLNGTVDVNGTFDVVGNSTFLGTVDVTGNTTVTGTFGATGATTLGSTLAVAGNTTIGGNATVTGNSRVDGTSDLRGTISNNAPAGEINIIDNTNITGNTGITGNLTVTGGPGQGLISGKDLNISQNATISQNLTVNQNATVAQNFTVGGHTSVATLDVTGAIVNPVSAAAPVNINDNLLVAGDATINGSLTILGDITATNITATNNLAAGNNLSVTNNGTFGGTLGVTGATTLNGATTVNNTLNVTNATTLGGPTSVNNTLNVTGATTLAGLTAGASTLNSLGVTNNATVGGTLGVTGATTLAGLTAGATTLNSLGVTNNATVGGTLGVTGAISGASLTTTGNVVAGGDVSGVNASFTNNVSAASGTFSGAVGAASVSTTGNISAGGTISGQLVNSLTNGAGIAAFTYNNTAAATVAIDNNAVTSAMIQDLTIVDADVAAAAAIAGTKINPNFGAQNVLTTGSISGNSMVSTTSVNAGTTVTAGTGISTTAGDINAPAGVIITGNAAGTNVLAGDLNVNGTTNFFGPTIANETLLAVKDVTVVEQLVLNPLTTASLNWDDTGAGLGQKVSFVIFNANGAAPYVLTNNPNASAGAVLYVHNQSDGQLTIPTSFGMVVLNIGQIAQLINTDGNAANWKVIVIN